MPLQISTHIFIVIHLHNGPVVGSNLGCRRMIFECKTFQFRRGTRNSSTAAAGLKDHAPPLQILWMTGLVFSDASIELHGLLQIKREKTWVSKPSDASIPTCSHLILRATASPIAPPVTSKVLVHCGVELYGSRQRHLSRS